MNRGGSSGGGGGGGESGPRGGRGKGRRRARATGSAGGPSGSGVGRGGGPNVGSDSLVSSGRGGPQRVSGSRERSIGVASRRSDSGRKEREKKEADERRREADRRRDVEKAKKEAEMRKEAEERDRAEREKAAAEEAERKRIAAAAAERVKVEAEKAKAREKAQLRWKERVLNTSFKEEDRPSETELRKLESSLKKCTAFVRRVSGGEGGSSGGIVDEGLLRECRLLNLTRYISEVVSAIADVKVRASEVFFAVRLCGELHRRYADFSGLLVEALAGVVVSSGKEGVTRRSALRILIELFVVGIAQEANTVISVVREAMKGGRGVSEAELTNMSLVAVFAKVASRSFIVQEKQGKEGGRDAKSSLQSAIRNAEKGSAPLENGMDEDADPLKWEESVLQQEIKISVTSTLQAYSRELLSLLSGIESDLHDADSAVLLSRVTRGVEDESAVTSAASSRKHQDRVYSAAVSITEALGRPPPEPYVFKADASLGSSPRDGARIVVGSFGGGSRSSRAPVEDDIPGGAGAEHEQPFDGPREFAFYRDLPELIFPGERNGSGSLGDSSTPGSKRSNTAGSGGSVVSGKRGKGDDGVEAPETPTLDSLLGRIWMVDSMEAANAFVSQFCLVSVTNRAAVKRLTKLLGQVPEQFVSSLPSYTRIAASLRPKFPDIAASVGVSVEDELRALIARTDHDEKSSASLVRASRYLGEYVKFELLPVNTFFDILGMCIKDFSGAKVEIACHLLETAGRYMYRSPATSVRTGNLLDTLWRLKSVRNLEARYNALVETAYFSSRPRGSSRPLPRKRRDPIHEYIRWRIYVQLSESNVEWTATHLRKLPWDAALERYVARKFLDVTCMRYSMYRPIAKLLAGLSKDRSSIGVAVVDGLVEAILVGLELNDGRQSQRRVAEVVLLGELFNSGLVHSPVIFQILYLLITYGHNLGKSHGGKPAWVSSEKLGLSGFASSGSHVLNSTYSGTRGPGEKQEDFAGDYFRVRLTCALLDTCGVRLVNPTPQSRKRNSPSKRQLEVFWVYFERYILSKTVQVGPDRRLPLHMEHIVSDTFEKVIRPLRATLASTDLRHKLRVRGSRTGPTRGLGAEDDALSNHASLVRSKTVEDAVAAVARVEANPVDLALVCLPQREFVRVESNKSREAASNKLTSSLRSPSSRYATSGKSDRHTGTSQASRRESSETVDTGGEGSSSSTLDGEQDCPSTDGDVSTLGEGELEEDEEKIDSDDESMGATSNGSGDVDVGEDGGTEDNDDNLSSESDISDDEEEDCVVTSIHKARTEEEDEFERELAAFTSSEVHSAKTSFTGHATLDRMAIPIGLMAKYQEVERAAAVDAAAAGTSDSVTGSSAKSKEPTVAFKMLVRRGGKSQIKELAVPSASRLAVATKESQTVGAAAHEELKRLVLESNTVVNGGDESADGGTEDDLAFEAAAASKRKEKNISEQRAADEQALLSTIFRSKPR